LVHSCIPEQAGYPLQRLPDTLTFETIALMFTSPEKWPYRSTFR
jgi:hypothetical protein